MYGTVADMISKQNDMPPDAKVMITVWTVDDVWEVRPDLTEEQAEDVLRVVNRRYGMVSDWDTLAEIATDLFGAVVVD